MSDSDNSIKIVRMKSRKSRDDGVNERGESDNKKNGRMKKNMQRLGGAGLSLEAFANAKSRNNAYNPALLSMLSLCFSLKMFF